LHTCYKVWKIEREHSRVVFEHSALEINRYFWGKLGELGNSNW